MSDVEYRILGSLEAVRPGEQCALGGAKQRALLAILLVNANRVVSTDALIEALWPDKPPGKSQTAIQGYVSALRKELTRAAIVTEAAGYRLPLESDQLDALRLETLAQRGRCALAQGDPVEAAAHFADALSLFRGTPLADFTYNGWARSEIERIEELRLACTEDRIEADLEVGRHTELVGELDALISDHPTRERFRAQLMLALYRSGRQAEALKAYQQARAILVDELGIEPSPELQVLQLKILNQDPAIAGPVRQAARASRLRLPKPATTFVGRDRECAEVVALLRRDNVRLITLTGPGGAGKTRLSLQAADQAASSFQGVYFCGLAPLQDPSYALPAIAHSFDIAEQSPTPLRQVLAEALLGRDSLLVLDNAEHLLPALADDVAFLRDIPNGPTLLVSSRERLDLHGEQLYPVPMLAESDAVELFGERASRSRPGVDLQDEAILPICQRLDFLPLAIELAAARSDLYPPQELLSALSERRELLVGPRDADPRHRTLETTITWGYELLSAEERAAFRALSVFPGGCTEEGARAVIGANRELLDALVQKNFLRTRDTDSERRYRMLETIREYGSNQLVRAGEAFEAVRRATQYLTALISALENALDHGDDAWVGTIQSEHENVLGLVANSLANGLEEDALALAVAVATPWYHLGMLEAGTTQLEQVLGRATPHTGPLHARALRALGRMEDRRGDREKAVDSAQRALALHEALNDLEQQCIDLGNIAAYYLEAGADVEARPVLEQTLEIAERLGDELEIARTSFNLGLLLERDDEMRAAAIPMFETSYELTTRLGHTVGALLSLEAMGEAYTRLGDHGKAFALLAESLELAISARSDINTAAILESLAECAFAADEHSAAREFAATADVIREQHGSARSVTNEPLQGALRAELELSPSDAHEVARDINDCLGTAQSLAARG